MMISKWRPTLRYSCDCGKGSVSGSFCPNSDCDCGPNNVAPSDLLCDLLSDYAIVFCRRNQ